MRWGTRGFRFLAGMFTFTLALSGPAAAQEPSSGTTADFVLAGYGSTTYGATLNSDYTNNFSASISPILLYQMGENLLFESELEFGLSGELTTTTLEYAQIDWLGWEAVQISAGKFLLPFGLYGERYHPAWINKLPLPPLLFGHGHGGVADESLLPILSDVGAMLRANIETGDRSHLDLTVWISQGPIAVSGEDDHEDEDPHPAQFLTAGTGDEWDIPSVGFGIGFADNNKNKMLGARIGLVTAPGFEIYLSGFHSMYDADSFLDYKAGALSVDADVASFELRAEAAVTWQEFEHEDAFDTLETPAYYVEISRSFGAWEPVAQWSQLLEGKVGDETARVGSDQFALGLDYWLQPSVPLKLAYQFVDGADDRVLLQLGFGF